MTNFIKVVLAAIIMIYMIVNESERIEQSAEIRVLERKAMILHNQVAEEFNEFKNHTHRYYDGKVKTK